jgi:hypothetical protein
MMSGSVIFKVESNHTNKYIVDMKPWVHYIPVKSDMSNLDNVTKLITQNDSKTIQLLETIASNSRKLAQKYTYSNQLLYVISSINKIANELKMNQINNNMNTISSYLNTLFDINMYKMPLPLRKYYNGSLHDISKDLHCNAFRNRS